MAAPQNAAAILKGVGVFCPHATVPDHEHTCSNPYHDQYSESDLPPLLFRLDPNESYTNPSTLPTLENLTDNGEVVYDADNNPIRDFDFLPRFIGVKVTGWMLEYWMRTDPRLTYRDIKARMVAPKNEQPSENTLNMRRERDCRFPLALSCWTTRRGEITRVEVERVSNLTFAQLRHNTTMIVELSGPNNTPQRLWAKTLAPEAENYYPLDLFLTNGVHHIASDRLRSAFAKYQELSARADQLGLRSWQLLPEDELPDGWKEQNTLRRGSFHWTQDYLRYLQIRHSDEWQQLNQEYQQ